MRIERILQAECARAVEARNSLDSAADSERNGTCAPLHARYSRSAREPVRCAAKPTRTSSCNVCYKMKEKNK